jgi:hypothetical protein
MQFGVTYGSFSAAIVLLVYLYLATAGLLFGAELNAVRASERRDRHPPRRRECGSERASRRESVRHAAGAQELWHVRECACCIDRRRDGTRADAPAARLT